MKKLESRTAGKFFSALMGLPLILLLGAARAEANPIVPASGALAWGSGITAPDNNPAHNPWASPSTSLSWLIIQISGGWNYQYTWNTAEKDLGNLILEIALGALGSNFSNLSANVTPSAPATYSPGDPGNSHPGLPAAMYGLKITPNLGTTSITFSFDSVFQPGWGGFYAKGGRNKVDEGSGPGKVTTFFDIYAYNSGGLLAVPVGYAGSGDDADPIPEPSSLILLGSGLVGMGILARNRRRSGV